MLTYKSINPKDKHRRRQYALQEQIFVQNFEEEFLKIGRDALAEGKQALESVQNYVTQVSEAIQSRNPLNKNRQNEIAEVAVMNAESAFIVAKRAYRITTMTHYVIKFSEDQTIENPFSRTVKPGNKPEAIAMIASTKEAYELARRLLISAYNSYYSPEESEEKFNESSLEEAKYEAGSDLMDIAKARCLEAKEEAINACSRATIAAEFFDESLASGNKEECQRYAIEAIEAAQQSLQAAITTRHYAYAYAGLPGEEHLCLPENGSSHEERTAILESLPKEALEASDKAHLAVQKTQTFLLTETSSADRGAAAESPQVAGGFFNNSPRNIKRLEELAGRLRPSQEMLDTESRRQRPSSPRVTKC